MAIVATMLLTATVSAAIPTGDMHFTFAISDLYVPYFSAAENAEVLQSFLAETSVVATYKRTTRSFSWRDAAGILDPGFIDNTTEQSRTFKLRPESGQTKRLGAVMPQSLEGGYVLSKLFFTLSPDTFYHQQGYRAIAQKLQDDGAKRDGDLPSPYIEFRVYQDEDGTPEAPVERQDCLDIYTPFGFPDTLIPLVIQTATHTKQLRLVRIMQDWCPLVNERFSEKPGAIPGRLPAARIAFAQAYIDYSTVKGKTFVWGSLPVTESMTRWYHRNSDGVYGSLSHFGPFERFAIRLRWDESYSVNGRLPVRTEEWSFFNQQLIKYANDVYYPETDKKEKEISIEQAVYFQNGKQVWMESKVENCADLQCQKVLVDVKKVTEQPFETLLNEVQGYRDLTLMPAEDN